MTPTLTEVHSIVPYQKVKLNPKPEIIPSTSSKKIPINLVQIRVQILWIKWKKNSCRIDVFSTLAYHTFYYDYSEGIFPILNGPKLPGELPPLRVLLKGIHEATTLQNLQKSVDI